VSDFLGASAGGILPVPGGLYYSGFSLAGNPTAFRYFDYATRRGSDIAPAPSLIESGLTVSPDERQLMYSAADNLSGDDLLMLEFQ
jgi:hypothetical protein